MITKRIRIFSLLISLLMVSDAQSQARFKRRRCPRNVIKKSGTAGTIETPGYPQTYRRRQKCVWRITVPKGYSVFLDFRGKFLIDCNLGDRVAVSSKRLYRAVKPRGSKYTVILCGQSRMKSVKTPVRDMWIRFEATEKKTDNIGFRAQYTAIDIDECAEKEHNCEQNCINTPGSFRCSCNSGYELATNGFNCNKIPVYEVKFRTEMYNSSILKTFPRGGRVLKVQAYVEGVDVQIKYSLVKRYPKPKEIGGSYPFKISSRTGQITSRRKLPAEVKSYHMAVQAQVNSLSVASVPVFFTVRTLTFNRSDIKFSSRSYSVIVSDHLTRGNKILDISITSRKAVHNVDYDISGKQKYFAIDNFGTIKLKRDFSELQLAKNSSKIFEFKVIARLRGSANPAASVVIKVIVVPAFSGDFFDHLVESSRTEENESDARSRKHRPLSEFTFHRFFRQLSPTARKISQAESKFEKVIQQLRESVVDEFTDQRLRSAGPIITNLSPISLASPDKLQELINATHCIVPKANCSNWSYHSRYRTFDGTCNNLKRPLWGAANVPFSRMIEAKYWDTEGFGEPIGLPGQQLIPRIPSAHLISERYIKHRKNGERKGKFSHMMMQWGQFLDHDITFTAESEGSDHCALPNCDGSREDFKHPCYPIMFPKSKGKECTMFTRSAAACQTDPVHITRREQLNQITSYIDGSQVYGSSLEQANSLRDFSGEYPGFMKLDPTTHLLPNLETTPKPPLNLCKFRGGCFAAGDSRANEQVALASMHIMWVHEHNRVAALLKYVNQHWDSERIFQEARKIVIAELQHITYHEYLTKLLGKNALPAYKGYNEELDATIFNAFATSAFRAGHSMVRPGFSRLDENFEKIGDDIPLVKAFFNIKLISENSHQAFILGLLGNVSERIDRGMAEGLTKHLFQPPTSKHGFNLAALNIQRGRDHGLPGYGAWRRECGLAEAAFFEETEYEIRSRKARNILDELYDVVEHSDLWVAGLAEDHVPEAIVGPTFHCILKRQFTRLRDGDRFWYEKSGVFTPEQLSEIKKVTLSRVICDNLFSVVSLQPDAFLAATNESQRVECRFGLPRLNISKWKEDRCKTENCGGVLATDPGRWTGWVHTKKTLTGSWGVTDRSLCYNFSIIAIECTTQDGRKAETTGEHYECKKDVGFFCRNIEQDEDGKICGDYRFRLRCSSTERAEPVSRPETTGYPSNENENSQKCNPDFRRHYYQVTTLRATVTQDVNIKLNTQNLAGLEYLYLGQNGQDKKYRFLIQFDLRKVRARSNLLSATLQLYLVNAGNPADGLEHSLEVYPITSTEWHSVNATAVVPWNKNYLGIEEDVDKNRVGRSSVIKSKDKERWINVDVFQSVFKWRSSTRRQENYGFMIKLANEQQALSLLRFASSSHANTSIHPNLLVCLNVPVW